MEYNYREAMKRDILQYLEDNYTFTEEEAAELDRDSFREEVEERLWTADEVTGNASGSYTFNRYKAQEYVLANWDLMVEAIDCFDDWDRAKEYFRQSNFEALDVTIRCYLLSSVLEEVLEEYA